VSSSLISLGFIVIKLKALYTPLQCSRTDKDFKTGLNKVQKFKATSSRDSRGGNNLTQKNSIYTVSGCTECLF